MVRRGELPCYRSHEKGTEVTLQTAALSNECIVTSLPVPVTALQYNFQRLMGEKDHCLWHIGRLLS